MQANTMLCLDMFKCHFHMGNSNVIPIGLHLHSDYENLAIIKELIKISGSENLPGGSHLGGNWKQAGSKLEQEE